MKIDLRFPPFRFFVAWFSFGVCITTGIGCLFFIAGIGKTSERSSSALHRLRYPDQPGSNQSSARNSSVVAEFDIPQPCLNFSSVVASVNQIKAQTSALRVSLYSSGVHWTAAQYQAHFGFPVYVLCLLSAFVALIASFINCLWPPEDDMDPPPGSSYKVRKIRMRVPQKHQRWSGYVYTHLESPRPGNETAPLVNASSEQLVGRNRREDDTVFDKGTMQFMQKTISACEVPSRRPDYT